MRLDPYVRDYSSFIEEIGLVLSRPSTRIYLDTSLLMWLVRLGGKARGELLDWVRSRPAGTVRVPVWAAHELHTHIVRNSLTKTIKSIANDVEKKYFEFSHLAVERADDILCSARGFSGRDSYISEVQASLAKLKRLTEVVRDEAGLTAATEEVIAFVNEHAMSTDLRPIVREVEQDGELRYSHLMPPGFHDKKTEDRFGDLIIWLEMAADMPGRNDGEARPAAVLISRDDKTDWVSGAPRILNQDASETRPNRDGGFDVVQTHPLLVHEFAVMTDGCALHVVAPGVLATALENPSAGYAGSMRTLVSSAYRPDQIANVVNLVRRFPPRPRPPVGEAAHGPIPEPTTSEDPGGTLGSFEAPALADMLRPGARRQIAEAAAATPDRQQQIFATWIGRCEKGDLAPVELGAVLAGFYAGAGVAADLPAMLDAVSSRLPVHSYRVVVLTIAANAYFDRSGGLLRPPVLALLGTLNAVADQRDLAPVFTALKALLDEAGANMLYVPGQVGRLDYIVNLAEAPEREARRLRSIKIAGENVLTEPGAGSAARSLRTLIGKDECTGLEMRRLLERTYAIPSDALAPTWDERRMKWDRGSGLAALDPDAPGGVSPLNNGEDR